MKSKLVSRRGYHLGCSVQAFEVENLVYNPVDAVFFSFSLKEDEYGYVE